MNLEFVSAGAGSGKTYRLMELITQALASGTAPDQILATTFTVKAAEEIRVRVQEHFLASGDFAKAEATQALRIGTVNALCGYFLGTFAFEAGLSPQLRVAEEGEAEHLLQQAVDSTLSESTLGELQRIELRFGLTHRDEEKWSEYLQKIIAAVRSNQIDPALLPQMAKRNADELLSCFGAPLGNPTRTLLDLLEDALPAMEHLQAVKEQKNTAGYLELCRQVSSDLANDRFQWSQWAKLQNGGAGKNVEDWPEKIQEVAAAWQTHPAFHQDIRQYLDLLFGAAARVLDTFAQYKTEAGIIDFVDQEALFYRLLERTDIQERLKESLGLVLIDEFQDTSPIELAIFTRLVPLARKTVWVGDVKQSIYGFRGSDASLMESILGALPSFGVEPSILGKSYRSVPSLVQFCNEVFIEAFQKELPVERVQLEPTRDPAAGPTFLTWTLTGTKERQAGALAGGILKLKASGYRWSDIAVLARTNATVDTIRQALSQAGIPLKVTGPGLLNTPEGTLVQACLRRLNDDWDTLASAEILALTQGLAPDQWLEERLNWLDDATNTDKGRWRCSGPNANPVLAVLEEMRPLAKILGPSELLQTLLVRARLDRYALAWTPSLPRTRARLANLDALVALAQEYEAQATHGASLSGLILWWQDRAGVDDKIPLSLEDGVEVLTWHKAKGLEWPVCICHDANDVVKDPVWKSVWVRPGETFSWDRPLEGRWIRLWPWPFGQMSKIGGLEEAAAPLAAPLKEASQKETRRLLYVGLTRAKDLLVLTHPENYPGEKVRAFDCLGPNGRARLESPDETWSPEVPDAFTSPLTQPNLRWFGPGSGPQEFLPAVITPSDNDRQVVAATVKAESIQSYGDGLVWTGDEDMRTWGTVYHAAVAFLAHNRTHPKASGVIDNLVKAHGLPSTISKPLMASVEAFLDRMGQQWPGAQLLTEWPVRSPVEGGRRIEGRLDLVVETKDGYHIVDHKLTEKPQKDINEFANLHAPQLQLYRQALVAQGEKPVLGLWLNAPRDGVMVEVVS